MAQTTIQVRHLENPTPEQIDEATRVIQAAFAGDPFITAILGGKETDASINWRTMRAHVLGTVIDGQLWVAEDADADADAGKAKIVGVAAWFPPGKLFQASEEQRARTGMVEVINDLPEGMQSWWFDYFIPKGVAQDTASHADGGRLPNWHLQVLAVLPAYHNRGIGRTLLLSVAERAWAAGRRVCWEASNEPNVAKYERWGGRVLSAERYENKYTGGITLYVMDLPQPGK